MTDDVPRRQLTAQEMRLTTHEQVMARRSPQPGPIEQAFFRHSGQILNKWIHYLPFYDRVLAPYRGRPIRMLEIGVSEGGSLELWREFFGPEATLFGIDINPICAKLATPPTQVRIGSQADPEFLRGVVAEMGGVDIVLDDGSHVASHQRTSFATLWPLLSAGGLYIIEDMHTAYWSSWEGGLRRPGTAVELVKGLMDDVNAWYWGERENYAPREEIGIITATDSIAAIEKTSPRPTPGHAFVGAIPPAGERFKA